MVTSRKNGWKAEEDSVLREFYRTIADNRDEILTKIPRTWGAIRKRAKQLGLFRGNYIPPIDRLPDYRPSEKVKVWLGCAVDCEGSIMIAKRLGPALTNGFSLLPVVDFCNTKRDIVERFRELTFPTLNLSKCDRNNPRWKAKYTLKVAKMPFVYVLLKKISPYLVIKNNQANLIIEFIEIESARLRSRTKYRRPYLPRQIEIFKELKNLNG